MNALELDVALLSSHISNLLGQRFVAPEAPMWISGGEYHVLRLTDESEAKRIAWRTPIAPPSPITSLRLDTEVKIRERIEAAGLKRFQPLLAHDSTVNNPTCRPFMILEWAEGLPLQWSSDVPRSLAQRESIIEAVANTSMDLLSIQRPGVTAHEWMLNKIERKIVRADANELSFGTRLECERQKELVREYWIPDLDRCPHVLVHGDLSSQNIIVDKNFVVTGIIDLGWADMVPLQYAAEYPRFLQNAPVETDSGISWPRAGDAQLQNDRLFYLACIKARAEREGGIALSYYQVLSRADELNRFWWCAAASRADAHRAMAACDWDPLSLLGRTS